MGCGETQNSARRQLAIALLATIMAMAFAPCAFAGGTPQASMASSVNSVLIYSNNMAYVSSTGTFESPGAGALALKRANFSSSAILGTVRAAAPEGSIYWMKRYADEKTVAEKSERYLTYDELLNTSYGKTVAMKAGNAEITGVLMWASGGMAGVKTEGGKIVIATPDRIDIENAQTRKTDERNSTSYENGLELYMGAKRKGNLTLSLSYITTGAAWTPTYNIEVAGSAIKGNGNLTAFAEVANNADEEWKDAAMRLAVGSPYFIEGNGYYPAQNYRNYALENSAMQKSVADSAGAGGVSFDGGSVGTQYIYSLSEPVSMKKGEKANFVLFNSGAEYARDNIWEGYGAVQQVLRVKNSAGKPFAPGVMRVFDEGVFAGEAAIAYTGEKREVEAKYAALPQITVKKESNQTSYKQLGDVRETVYAVSMAVESSALEGKPLTLRDYMASGDRTELLKSSIPAKQLSGNGLEWKLDVPSGANITVTYEYRVTNFNY